jgi:hypothetical protein
LDDRLNDAEYLAQTEVFFHVSRLKKPNAHLVSFSDAQKQQVLALLEPGDILLTFTAGYASDVFIPGAFKHGITSFTHEGLPQLQRTLAAAEAATDAVRDLARSLKENPSQLLYQGEPGGVEVPR